MSSRSVTQLRFVDNRVAPSTKRPVRYDVDWEAGEVFEIGNEVDQVEWIGKHCGRPWPGGVAVGTYRLA